MKYKYLLFDADNTLFDFDLSEKQAFLSLESVSPGAFDEAKYALYHEINDRQWKKLEQGLTTKEKLKTDRFFEYYDAVGMTPSYTLVEKTAKAYMLALGQGNALIEGAIQTLEYLCTRYEIYIITNGVAVVQKSRFNSSEIRKYVKALYISEEIGFDKPDRRYFDRVLMEIDDADIANYLVIGDSLSSDIKGAVDCGIDCVYFDRLGKGHDQLPVTYTITSLTELISIL